MKRLVLLRHGQSVWNSENRLTGWTDVGLTFQGENEARQAAQLLFREGYSFDFAFTSYLKRAIKTMWIVLEEMDLIWIPEEKSWCLNERHYGALQGLNKEELIEKYGKEQVFNLRRSYDLVPPALEMSDISHPRFDPRYKDLEVARLPAAESLRMTEKRVVQYWEKKIVPRLKEKDNGFICAHGNSLRGLIKYLDNISEQDITQLGVPNGKPFVYEFDEAIRPIKHFTF